MATTASRRWNNIDFVECKTWGHAWAEYDPYSDYRNPTGFVMTLRCERCTTRRHDFLNPQGHVVGRQYFYVDGYRYKDPFGNKPSRDDMRLFIIKRGKR